MQDNWIKGLGGQSPYAEALRNMKPMGQLPMRPGPGGIDPGFTLSADQAARMAEMFPNATAKARPMSLGQGDNVAPWMHDQGARAAMMAQEAMRGGAGMPQGAMPNMGKAQGNFDNYFPEARMNMPMPRTNPAIPAVGGNMGMAQGNPDNYFPEARMNSPFGRSPAMAKMGAAPKAQNISIPNRSQTSSPGIRKDGSRIDYSAKSGLDVARKAVPPKPMNNKKVKDIKR